MTPLMLAVNDAPIPFAGSDGATHFVYEFGMTNFSSGRVLIQKVEILGDGAVLQMLDTAAVADGQPEQTPGKYPTNIPLDDADGNSVILDLGEHRYALYAHLRPGSIKVHRGERVTLGQTLGLVGGSRNSIMRHRHFQVTGGPSSMASNGLPYEIRNFLITGKVPGTEAFDKSETDGSPLPVAPISPPQNVKDALPLDQYIISFKLY
jgi:hypothetical protein